ncbi:universal stress protein [Halorarius litoreus]|uniref:universal stress protein n=1 Tax=Halorarius litoreus TaxID=2962676 RepID=UPI0020CF7636|nr:universal stress protein [Halorarius litoreus]
MYDTILVPTDGSETVDRTLPHALRLASDHDATVHALSVVDTRMIRASTDDLRADVKADLEAQADDAVASVADAAREADIAVETEVRQGAPDREIVEYAEETDADVIVLGPQGKTPREKVGGLGSVSDRVASDAAASVFLVKQGDD